MERLELESVFWLVRIIRLLQLFKQVLPVATEGVGHARFPNFEVTFHVVLGSGLIFFL
jgi:hypothetical protein